MKKVILIIVLVCFASCKKATELDLSSLYSIDVQGTWNLQDSCHSFSGAYAKMTYVFVGNNYNQTVRIYSNSNCSSPLLTFGLSATYAISNVVDNFLEYRGDFDETLADYTVTVNDASVVSNYNTNNFCGFNDWQLNVPKSVLGRNCGGGLMPSAGAVNYNIIMKITTTTTTSIPGFPPIVYTAGDIYFGIGDATNDGSTPSRRYSTGDGSYVFRKQ